MYWDDNDYYYGFGRPSKEPKNYSYRPFHCKVLMITSEGKEHVIEFDTFAKSPTDAIEDIVQSSGFRIIPILIWPTSDHWEKFDKEAA